MGLQVDIKKQMKGFALDVAFHTEKNTLGILGASGSGKSMTLKCIAGIERPDEGRIVLNGRVLFDSKLKINLRPQERQVGYLFQNYALFPHMSVLENIGAGLKMPKEEKLKKIHTVLESFHLKGLENKYPHQLSGGQQQRVALARCLIYEPEVLMLDEPFSALDAHLKDHLQSEVMSLLEAYKGEVIMVSHNRDEIYRFCENAMILHEGKSILYKDTKLLFKDPELFLAARLTGCKNFSRCDVIDQHTLYAKDWHVTLKTKSPITKAIFYVGIRAHDILLLQESDGFHHSNTIPCHLIKTVEDVFDYNHYFVHDKYGEMISNPLLYTIGIKDWIAYKNQRQFHLHLPEDALLLLE